MLSSPTRLWMASMERIVGTLLQARIHRRQCLVAPAFQPMRLGADLPRNQVERLTAQQAEDGPASAGSAPALNNLRPIFSPESVGSFGMFFGLSIWTTQCPTSSTTDQPLKCTNIEDQITRTSVMEFTYRGQLRSKLKLVDAKRSASSLSAGGGIGIQ
jgi:hypothetical protein